MHDLVWLEPDEHGRYPRGEVTTTAKTPWSPTGDVVDLAKSAAERADLRRRAGGPLPAPQEGEMGSAWNRYRLYQYYEDGLVFENGPLETIDVEEMLQRTGIAAALEAVLTLPIRAAGWQIKPAPGDKGECDFVKMALETPPEQGGMSVPLQLVIGQMTAARLYRRSYFEKVWTHNATGKVVLEKLASRPPTTCYLARSAEDASMQGFMQWSWKGLQYVKVIIPKEKAFVYLHGAHRNPLLGVSDMQLAYNAYASKQKLRFLWYQFLTVEAMPRVLAKHSSADQGEADQLARRISQLRGGGVVGLKSGQDATVIPSGSGGTEFSAALAYLDQEMLASVLAGFIGLVQQARSGGSSGSGSARGSSALSQDQSQFFLKANEAVTREMASQFTVDVISSLCRYNFPTPAVPHLVFTGLAENDASSQAITLLQSMVAAATPTPLLPNAFIDELVEKVAGALELNVTNVAAAVKGMDKSPSSTPGADAAAAAAKQAQETTPGPAGQLHGAIDAVGKLVAAHAGGASNGHASAVAPGTAGGDTGSAAAK